MIKGMYKAMAIVDESNNQAICGVKKVFVCGAGHQGLSMAAHLALNGLQVTLWNRTYRNIAEIAKDNTIYCHGVIEGAAHIEKVSDNIAEVISDFIMITTPSSAHRDVAKKLAPYVHKNNVIILNPGRTFGAIDFADALMQCGVKEMPQIAETQTIVYTCRRNTENSTIIFALKPEVEIAALRNSSIDNIMAKMPACLKQYFKPASSVARTSLSNVGMVLHCAPVLMNIGWIENKDVAFKYYYDGISRSVARFVEKIDAERLEVSKAMGFEIESVIQWMCRTYCVQGDNLYECIRNNDKYREIDAPPQIRSRYILEDVPNGLVPIEELGKQLGIATPNITTIINLANSVFEQDFREEGRRFSIEKIKQYL